MKLHKPKKGTLKRAFVVAAAALALGGGLTACSKPADTVSQNLSNAADNFRINRQIDFINTITGENIVTVQGLCSLGNNDVFPNVTVTCKTDDGYIKDFFIVTPTTTVATVQIGAAEVSSAHYSLTWNPSALVPIFNGTNGAPLTPTGSNPSATPAPTGSATTAPTKVIVIPGSPTAAPSK